MKSRCDGKIVLCAERTGAQFLKAETCDAGSFPGNHKQASLDPQRTGLRRRPQCQTLEHGVEGDCPGSHEPDWRFAKSFQPIVTL